MLNLRLYNLFLSSPKFIMVALSLCVIMQSCQDEAAQMPQVNADPEGTPASVWLKKDSVQIKLIDSLVGVNKERMYKYKNTDTKWLYFEDAPLDSAEVSLFNGELIHVAFQSFMPAQELWNDVFLKDGNVFFFRYREWNKRPEASSARELFYYFWENEELVYASERYRVLKPNDIPADLLFDEMKDCTRTKEDAMSFVNQYWPQIKAEIESQLAKK